jgi:hypothetical protein
VPDIRDPERLMIAAQERAARPRRPPPPPRHRPGMIRTWHADAAETRITAAPMR